MKQKAGLFVTLVVVALTLIAVRVVGRMVLLKVAANVGDEQAEARSR